MVCFMINAKVHMLIEHHTLSLGRGLSLRLMASCSKLSRAASLSPTRARLPVPLLFRRRLNLVTLSTFSDIGIARYYLVPFKIWVSWVGVGRSLRRIYHQAVGDRREPNNLLQLYDPSHLLLDHALLIAFLPDGSYSHGRSCYWTLSASQDLASKEASNESICPSTTQSQSSLQVRVSSDPVSRPY